MIDTLRIIVVGSPELGGSGIVAHNTAVSIAERGNKVTFLSHKLPFGPVSPKVSYEVATPFEHPLFPFPLQELALAEHIRLLCLNEHVDVLHVHYALFFGQAAVSALAALPPEKKPKLVITCHGTDIVGAVSPSGKEFSGNPTLLPVLKAADRVVAVSYDLRDKIHLLYGKGISVDVIHNSVDLELFTPKPFRSTVEKVVLHASNFRPIKQADLVVHTLAELGSGFSLVLAGIGPEHDRILDLGEKLLGKNRCKSYGALDENALAILIQAIDVLFQPSRYESFSLAALEAHACGKPVVGTLSGGMKEVVINGKTGVLLSPDTPPEKWAEAVRSVLTLPHIHRETRQVAEMFSEDRMAQSYLSLFANLLEQPVFLFDS